MSSGVTAQNEPVEPADLIDRFIRTNTTDRLSELLAQHA